MSSRTQFSLSRVALAAVLTCFAAPTFAAGFASSKIAWQQASSDVEVDRAFALGKKTGKPVFLYWGAVWCPPCNQVKATLFSRADFVERSRAFIPVYVDGDKPGAQKVAARFKVTGYPTMVLFKPDGTEITRLPGEVDPQRYLLTLTAGLEAELPVKDLLKKAFLNEPLTPEQWRLLAFYSWDTDEQQVVSTKDLPQKLLKLSAGVPKELREVSERLGLKALVALARSKTESPTGGTARESGVAMVHTILSDPISSRRNSDILVSYADELVQFLEPAGDSRKLLARRIDSALARIYQDPMLSRSDQVDLLHARVGLWKITDGSDRLSEAHQHDVLRETAKIVLATTDRYERQAVIPGAAHTLGSAGLSRESDELLKQELGRAIAPYYHMLGLAGNAKKRDDHKDALYWYERAWKKSEGSATRIQWGAGFVGHVVELAPTELGRIEAAASAVISELQPLSETFYERNQRSLIRMASRLVKWQGTDPARVRVVEKIKVQLSKTCLKLKAGDIGGSNCRAVFTPPSPNA
ncbi:thioredoxin family protein [Caenimonas sp. SL110]|uniref:thioredoxin family protein n=1 Tax=Caenimonas sp. SL110 TaxID=1450524 RepID=UPI0006530211|nr:thioredoxin family protein [Caenimonas sp. SL110]